MLCVTNFPEELEDYKRFARDKAELVLHWRVIDWGSAWVYGDEHTIAPGSVMRCKRQGNPQWNSSFGYVSKQTNRASTTEARWTWSKSCSHVL